MIRVGIIGIGFGQHVLLPAFRTVDTIEVCAIAATSFERAKKVAELHHVPRAYGSWQCLVNDPDIDALAIAVPPLVQQDIITAALHVNKHLFCEKPLGLSLHTTEKFVIDAKRKKLANMVDFEFCIIPAWRMAKKILQNNEIGNLKSGLLNWQTETYTNRMKINNWKTNQAEGGGALFNFASHVFYNLEWLCGPACEIFMTGDNQAIHGMMKFINGFILSFCVGTASYCGAGQRVEIYGEQGSLQLINSTADIVNGFSLSVSIRNGKNMTESLISIDQKRDGRISTVSVLAESFADWILTGTPKEPSFAHGHRVNVLIQACQTSCNTRQWVDVLAH